jgi:glycine dehydrogenase subunit 1
VKGFKAPRFDGHHFNEFIVTSESDSAKIHKTLLSNGVHGGLILDRMFPELGNSSLYATTEMHTKQDHDKLISALEGIR